MIFKTAITEDKYSWLRPFRYILFCWLLALLLSAGCRIASPRKEARSESGRQQVFNLKHLDSGKCIAFLSQLGIGKVSKLPEANSVLVNGSSEQLQRTSIVLSLVDTDENFVIHNFGPASMVRSLPSNSQIATAQRICVECMDRGVCCKFWFDITQLLFSLTRVDVTPIYSEVDNAKALEIVDRFE